MTASGKNRAFSSPCLSMAKGRLRLRIAAQWLGPDLLVTLTGGSSHIGACALASPPQAARVLQADGHREGELAQEIGEMLAGALQCAVAVICGIHYNDISQGEIKEILAMARSLAARLAETLQAGRGLRRAP